MGKLIARELDELKWGLAGCLLFIGISSPAFHQFYKKSWLAFRCLKSDGQEPINDQSAKNTGKDGKEYISRGQQSESGQWERIWIGIWKCIPEPMGRRQKPLGRSGDARYSAGVWYVPYKVRGVIPWRIWVETRVLVPGDIFSWDFFIWGKAMRRCRNCKITQIVIENHGTRKGDTYETE